jgi:CelD/BcsL family acetyltransferase involved in cellulose biosynthesis
MRFDTRILRPTDPDWGTLLARASSDCYHEASYVNLEAKRLDGGSLAVVVENSGSFIMLPLVVRTLPPLLGSLLSGHSDATSPYGYPGFLLCGEKAREESWLLGACQAMLDALRRERICSIFVRSHTFLTQPLAALAELGTLVDHGETVWLDLTQSDEEYWNQLRTNHRRIIRRLKKLGVQVHVDVTWKSLEEFVEIYHQTMRDVHAQGSYYFDRQYFDSLRLALHENIHLCNVRIGGELVAGGLFLERDGLVQYHLGATASLHRKLAPSRLMFDFMRDWARKRGHTHFHLGGGVGGQIDSLFHFKAGFSPLRARFFTWRAVVDSTIYEAASSRWEEIHSLPGDEPTGFFPCYRMPVLTTGP